MAAPPQGPGQMPQPYPGMYYQPMSLEGQLTRRNVFFANAFGLGLMWLAVVFRLATTDTTVAKIAIVMVITGAFIAVLVSLASALGSKRTTDMQNVGLFVWSGLLLAFSGALLTGLALI